MEVIMAYYILVPTTIVLAIILSKLLIVSNKRRRCSNLPPSPPSLPLIGHLHLLKEPIHRTLQTLSNKYGPIYFLSMGVRNVVVVSSPSLVEECFNKNDVVFANRPFLVAGKILHYNYTTVGAAPYGPHWRDLRRLTSVEMLSTARLNSSLNIRQEEVRLLIRNLFNKVSGGSGSGNLVEMKTRLSGLSMNVVMRMVAGTEEKEGEDEGKRFQDVISEVFELSGASNPADFLPMLRWVVDLKGMEKRMWTVLAKFDGFFQGLIDDRRKKDYSIGKTMIDSFLRLQESDPKTYSDDIIKGQVTYYILVPTTIILAIILSKLLILSNKRRRCSNLPPSPPSLPFIGHLHLLKEPIHKTLQTLPNKYGPIYFLSMGVRNVVVVSSPSLVEECFNKNDVVFANRPFLVAGKRSDREKRRNGVIEKIHQSALGIAKKRRVTLSEFKIVNQDPPALSDKSVITAMEDASKELNLTHKLMISRAYHDSLFMARVSPMGMLFIPCFKGYSHKPEEYASSEDIANGVKVLALTMAKLSLH